MMVTAKWRTVAIALLVVGTMQWLICLAHGEERPAAPQTIKELIEQQLGPIKKPPFVIKRCKWPCERSA